jgi:protein gp37
VSEKTSIEWTDATWNPIGGCTRVDEGCRNCYAEIMAARFSGPGQWGDGLAHIVGGAGHRDHRWTGEVRLNATALDKPLRWRKPSRIFVNSTSDLFHEAVPDEWIDEVFAVMALCPQHTFQVLTKRPARMRKYLNQPGRVGDVLDACLAYANGPGATNPRLVEDGIALLTLPNVWLGTSISDQASADLRIPVLLDCPAAVRFLSVEPMLGPVALDAVCTDDMGIYALTGTRSDGSGPSGFSQGTRIDWVICGGESGPGARPMHPDWARSLRDQCAIAEVPFFFKQWGEWAPLETTSDRAGLITGKTPRAQWHDACGLIKDTADAEDGLTFFSEGQVFRIGKSRAGRLLDGQTWDQMPGKCT